MVLTTGTCTIKLIFGSSDRFVGCCEKKLSDAPTKIAHKTLRKNQLMIYYKQKQLESGKN